MFCSDFARPSAEIGRDEAGDLGRSRLRDWGRVPVVYASDGALQAEGLFALHPPGAVLGFEASIDGLLW
jgi:hypothetical protein